MGNPVARLGDKFNPSTVAHVYVEEYDSEGHFDDWDVVDVDIEGNVRTASSNVFANGVGVARKNDTTFEYDTNVDDGGWDWTRESDIHDNAIGFITGGSPKVFVNGLAIARQGDTIKTHASSITNISEGSANVYSG